MAGPSHLSACDNGIDGAWLSFRCRFSADAVGGRPADRIDSRICL